MNKFKFQPPQEHRRSLLPNKNQHIALTTTLDKCTQILREDRLFIRNQIKNNNLAILDIFKLYARPSQFQNLQVKLRKYVQNIKNQQKAEQLSKFKETLHSNNNSHSTTTLSKRPNMLKPAAQSTFKHSIKQNSLELLNKHNHRDSRSQEHQESSNKYLNHSLKHFQDLLKYKFNQEIIQERQSENVTSARLARSQYEQNKGRPLQEQLYDSNENRILAKNNYNLGESLKGEDFNGGLMYKDKMRFEEIKEIKGLPWYFQNKPSHNINIHAKNDIKNDHKNEHKNEYKNEYKNETKHDVDLYKNRTRTFESYAKEMRDEHFQCQQKEQSIFDKHFNQSQKVSSQHSRYQNNPINEFKNIIPTLNDNHHPTQGVLLQPEPSEVYFQMKEQSMKDTFVLNDPYKSRIEGSGSSSRNQENLFTPEDLLNQCRNFLKNRESTLKKSIVNNDSLNNTITQSLAPISSEKECLFNRNNIQQEEVVLMKPKLQEKSYIFPEVKESARKTRQSFGINNFIEQKIQYNNLQTFANIHQEKPLLSLPTFQVQHQRQNLIQHDYTYTIPDHFSIESFLENLIEHNDLNPFMTVKNLKELLNNIEDYCDLLRFLFKDYLQQPNSKEIFIVKLAQRLNQSYNQDHDEIYGHNDKEINFIYQLLDIDLKGFINRQDIKLFLAQIQEAEVQNYQEVEEQLWRLFQGADFTNEQRLSYWHFSFVKNSEQFEKVSLLLSQFEFQIQRN